MKYLYTNIRSVKKGAWLTLATVGVLLNTSVNAQLNVAAVNTAYIINFDGTVGGVESGVWAGGGFQPVPINGRLDSDAWAITGFSDGSLAFGGTQITTATDFRRGTTAPGNGAVAAGGIYSFGGAPIVGRALGVQPGAADFTPGTFTLRVQNNTGSTLTAFDLAYDVYYRNDQGFSNNFNLYFSDDNTTYTYVPSQDVVSPAAAAGAAWVANARATTVSGVNVPNGQYFYVRWRGDDVSGSGSRDEFALDNISVTGRAYTLVRYTASTASVNESVGTTTITASIVNPHPTNATTVDVALTSGSAARINGYTTQTLTFPGGSLANQSTTITVTDNGACDGNEIEVFTLQNVTGGITPSIGIPSTHTLTIDDDETAAVTFGQAFDGGVGDTWAITAGAGNQSSATGAGDTPANERVLSTTQSWQVNNGTVTLDLGTVSTVDWTGITLNARLSSTSTTGGNGADGADSVAFFVDIDGAGFPVDADISIAGNSNRRFGYGAAGVATTTAGTPVNYVCNFLGNGIDYSTVQITIPNGTSTVALRVISKNNSVDEVWNIDNVSMSGTLCSPVYYSRANGSEVTGTWSTARTGLPAAGVVTFNKNATMVVQNTHNVATTNNASIALRNLNVETGGTLGLTGVSTIEINGPTFDIDGTFTAADDDIDLFSDELTTISGSAGTIDVNNMTLDGFGAQVTVNTLKIRGTLQLDNGNFDANLKEVQLISTVTGTARLGPVAPTASFSSRLRIERFIPAGATDWRLLCSPMAGDVVTDWTDDFFTAGFPGSAYPNFYSPPNSLIFWPSVRKYDETNAGLLDLDGLIGVSSVSEPLTVGKGFAAWSGTTLNTTTAFNVDVRGLPTIASSPFTIPMSYTNTPATAAVDGLNLVGNPLPSPIDFGSLSLGADVDNNYYIYDPGSGLNVGWDETTSTGTGGCNGNIQSSQGFWLHCTGAANTVTVTESAKVLEPINGGVFSDQEENRPMVRLRLSGNGNAYTDEALVHFIAGSPDYGAPDMVKLSFANDNAMRITTKATSGEDLMINAYGELVSALDIAIKVQVPTSGDYSIALEDVGPAIGRACMTLEDLLTGASTEVTEGAMLNFSIDATAPVEPARFVLHVGQPVVTTITNATCADSNNGTLVVTGPNAGPLNYMIVLPSGDVISETEVIGAQTFNNLAAGDYQLYVEGNTGCGALAQDIRIEAPGLLAGEATTHNAACAFAADGSADLMVMGGVAPYGFAWSDGSTSEDLSNVSSGNYSVIVTDVNGCEAEVANVNIGADSGPVAAFESSTNEVDVDTDVFFFNTGTYGLSYTWDLGDGTITAETEPVHQYAAAGVYTVTLTTTNGECSDIVSHDILVNGSTGISANELIGMNAWTEGSQFIVQWQVEGAKSIRAELIDATGRTVVQRSAKGAMGRVSITAQELPAGVYYVRLRAGSIERTFKLPLVR
ncbi:MAG: PKD domain-containing protein [Flavobacteriales bacterium]|nr:PKD domain-containing protein [Flavobacteriales bacterium]